MTLPNKQYSRKEILLNSIATGSSDVLPDPQTREEIYLKYIAENGSAGGTGGTGISKDEKVKMYSTSSGSKYLSELLDGSTIVVNNDRLVCKSIDGQNVTVAELNTLQGMSQNIKQVLDSLSSAGMSFKGTTPTYASLNLITDVVGSVYIVLADETNNNVSVTYIKDNNSWIALGQFGVVVRDFATDKIDLTSEVKNKLPKSNMDMTGIASETFVMNEIGKINTSANHTHDNKSVIDGLNDNNGELEYNGKPIGGVGGHEHDNAETLEMLGDSASMLTYRGKVVVNNNEYSFKTLPRRKAPITKMLSDKGGRLPWQA